LGLLDEGGLAEADGGCLCQVARSARTVWANRRGGERSWFKEPQVTMWANRRGGERFWFKEPQVTMWANRRGGERS
jgi:hypothetical protein